MIAIPQFETLEDLYKIMDEAHDGKTCLGECGENLGMSKEQMIKFERLLLPNIRYAAGSNLTVGALRLYMREHLIEKL